MARQKSDDCVVPQSCRKTVSTRSVERFGGGKAVTVNEQMGQLQLPFETAESPEARAEGADGGVALRRRRAATRAAPKSKGKKRKVPSAPMEENSEHCRPGRATTIASGIGEVVTRPVVRVITHHPEEPYVNSTSTVLWELGAVRPPATR
jgi:hypothetical protein